MTTAWLRQAAADIAERSRTEQGLPPLIEDPVVLRRVAAIITATAQTAEGGGDRAA